MRTEQIQNALDCPAVRGWVKKALRELMARDPVDAANDADLLARLMDDRCRRILARADLLLSNLG